MCGIAGALGLRGETPLAPGTLRRMLALLHHRGPEAAGIYAAGPVALGHARLSIIDLAGGAQPIANEDETLWLIVNGEIFNYVELAESLRARGHRFRTASDSEVILHLYEEHGTDLLEQLNGDFAFALWDERRRRLFLGRDRVGVRPLFYTVVDGVLLFASEVKALLADPRVPRRPDIQALDQVFTYWAPLPGRTMFAGIRAVPAGHMLLAEQGADALAPRRYWVQHYPAEEDRHTSAGEHAERLRALLIDAVRLRLRADVPVGAYLSGGLDSSAIAAIVQRYTTNHLQIFSVCFEDAAFDERNFQQLMAARLGADHHVVECRQRDIATVFPRVIWHGETPILRTAPAPLFLLSALVRRHGFKVVLTGEGADEFLAGYNIFKEALVRRFWARQPDSRLRPSLLRALYDWLPGLQSSAQGALEGFFRQGLLETDDPAYSHQLRWRAGARARRMFSTTVQETLAGYDSTAELQTALNPDLHAWPLLSRAQHLEVQTFLTPYLLSSQGDRMAMAHAVEGRFPFLDPRVIACASAIPAPLRMRGLDEKHMLKRAVADLLPPAVLQRPKRPYRAPISAAFCGAEAPEYVDALLAPEAIREAGLFNAVAVSRLLAKCRSSAFIGEQDNMLLAGVLSTQIWHEQFIRRFSPEAGMPHREVRDYTLQSAPRS